MKVALSAAERTPTTIVPQNAELGTVYRIASANHLSNVGKLVVVTRVLTSTGFTYVVQELKDNGGTWSFPNSSDNGWGMGLEELPKGSTITLEF